MLEKAEPIQRFKASYRHGRTVATANRALSALRGAINWGRFQNPPLLKNSPFHRFGVTIRTKDETKRDRRVGARRTSLHSCLGSPRLRIARRRRAEFAGELEGASSSAPYYSPLLGADVRVHPRHGGGRGHLLRFDSVRVLGIKLADDGNRSH